MASKKILVTGANGQLGCEIRQLTSRYPHFEFVFADRTELSIENQAKVEEYFNNLKPFACINCAAYTAVDKAESEKERAHIVNAQAVGFLASACFKNEVLLVHLSTDYVFDGSSSIPYKETDETNPINHY